MKWWWVASPEQFRRRLLGIGRRLGRRRGGEFERSARGWSLLCLWLRDHPRRGARAAVFAIRRAEHGVDDLAAVEHDEVVHAALLFAAVAVEQVGEAAARANRERLAELGDDLIL